jgi:hypothetical protein
MMKELHIPYEKIRHRKPDFVVSNRFYSHEEGGRRTGTPVQGYRSDFLFKDEEAQKQLWCIHPEFLDADNNIILDKTIPISKSGKAYMWILDEEKIDFHRNRIRVGQKGYFMEGPTKTAECEVIELIGLKYQI